MKKITQVLVTIAFILIGIQSAHSQWQAVSSPLFNRGICVAASGQNVFVATAFGFYLSTDSGSNWMAINNGFPIYNQVSAIAISDSTIFAGTEENGIFISTDTGSNWTAVNNGFPIYTFVNAIAIKGSSIFVGTYDGVFVSNNNGGSWTVANTGLQGDTIINGLVVMGSNIFAGTPGGVYLSSNNGASWIRANNGITAEGVGPFAVSGTNIFAGTSNGVFLSSNNGTSWTSVNSGITFPDTIINTIAAIGTNIFIGAGDLYNAHLGIFLSTNNGTSWVEADNGIGFLTTYGIGSIATSSTYIWAIQDSCALYKRSLSDILAVENISASNNDFTIYPNPATTQLILHTTLKGEHATVSIMNVLGQITSPPAPLLQERGEALIDVSKFPSGMYFLQLKTDSGSVVKRFVKE